MIGRPPRGVPKGPPARVPLLSSGCSPGTSRHRLGLQGAPRHVVHLGLFSSILRPHLSPRGPRPPLADGLPRPNPVTLGSAPQSAGCHGLWTLTGAQPWAMVRGGGPPGSLTPVRRALTLQAAAEPPCPKGRRCSDHGAWWRGPGQGGPPASSVHGWSLPRTWGFSGDGPRTGVGGVAPGQQETPSVCAQSYSQRPMVRHGHAPNPVSVF